MILPKEYDAAVIKRVFQLNRCMHAARRGYNGCNLLSKYWNLKNQKYILRGKKVISASLYND